MSGAGIRVEQHGAIDILSLDRPAALNAITPATADALTAYFTGLQAATRVVILRAEGEVFCAGAALDSDAFVPTGPGRAQTQLAMQWRYSGIVRAMRGCAQPIIALIQGAACGAGFSLALAADVRFGTPRARMNAAYLRVGLGGCDMGSGYLLPRLVGLSAASEFLLTGRFIDAARAKAMGLLSDVVPAEALLATGLALAEDMLKASPMGLRMTKETLNFTIDAPSLEAALAMEDRQQVMLLETADHAAAVAAFRGKRAPDYQDK